MADALASAASWPRVPVCAYAVSIAGASDQLEVVLCNDGTSWTLREDTATKTLTWTRDDVPPIPGSPADLLARAASPSQVVR